MRKDAFQLIQVGVANSELAAPAFRNIAQRIVGLPAEENTPLPESPPVEMARVELPLLKNYMYSFEGMDVKKAVKELRKKKLEYEVVGTGNLVYRQEPAAYSELKEKQTVKLFTQTKPVTNRQIMPQLTGLTLREALQVLSDWNIEIEIEGSGVVVKQLPGPGKKIGERDTIKLVCNPA